MRGHLGNLTTGLFAQLTIPGRLEPNDEYQKSLCALLGRAQLSGDADLEQDGISASVRAFEVEIVAGPWTPADGFGRARMEAKLFNHFNLVNKNALVYIWPQQSVVAVLIESVQKDEVLKAMHAELRKSVKGQLSGARPAVLCCHLADLTQDGLLALGRDGQQGTGLDYLATALMLSKRHLYSMTYTTSGSVGRALARIGGAGTVGRVKGSAYTVLNPDHLRAGDERLSVFLAGWPPSKNGSLG